MKALITGGNGYIGRKLAAQLSGKYDTFLLGNEESDLPNYLKKDIRDPNLDLSEYDIIFHLAAVSLPKLVDADRDAAWDINVRGTMNICSKLKKGQRLVFMSSAHVYNRSIQTPHKEDEIPAPKNFYGFTKSVGEDAIRFYAAEKGLSYVIFRLFNSYSKDQRAGLIIGDVIEKYRKNDTIEMFDPDSELDMVHIDDVITILQDADTLEQGTYNLCTGKPIKIREIYLRIKKYLGMDKKKETVVSDRKQKLLGDGSKLRSIGFKFREFSLD